MRHLRSRGKLGRPTDQRMALLRNMVSALFMEGHVETTLARAKSAQAMAERLLSRALQGRLEDMRIVARSLAGKAPFRALKEKVIPSLSERSGGHTKVVRVRRRRGDGSIVARLYIPGHPELREEEKGRG